MRINYLIISLLFLFIACSSKSGDKMKPSSTSNQTDTNDNPNKLGYDVFAALKENNPLKFSDSFLGAKCKDEMATMLTSVKLTPEQKSNTLTFLNNTVGFFSNNENAGINNFFQYLRQQAIDKGVDWETAEISRVNSSIVDIKDFGIIINAYKVDIEFKDKNDIDHMITIPRAYRLPSGVIAGDAKVSY